MESKKVLFCLLFCFKFLVIDSAAINTAEDIIPANIIDEANQAIGNQNATDLLKTFFGGNTTCNETNNEVFTLCQNCYSTCQKLVPDVFVFPKPGCKCKDGYIRDETTNNCFDLKEAKTKCGASDEIISDSLSKKRNTVIDITIEQRILYLQNNSDVVLNSNNAIADEKTGPLDIDQPPVTADPITNLNGVTNMNNNTTGKNVDKKETIKDEKKGSPTSSGTIPPIEVQTISTNITVTPIENKTSNQVSSTPQVTININKTSPKNITGETEKVKEASSITTTEQEETPSEEIPEEDTDKEQDDDEEVEQQEKSRSKRDIRKKKLRRASKPKNLRDITNDGFSFMVNNKVVSIN